MHCHILYCEVWNHEKCEIVQSGRKCVQQVGGPTVTLSKHGSLAQGLFWDPLVAPWPRGGTRGATQKHLRLQPIDNKIYVKLFH